MIAHKDLPRIRGAIARDGPNSHNAIGCNRSQRFERRVRAQKFEFTRIQDDVIACEEGKILRDVLNKHECGRAK